MNDPRHATYREWLDQHLDAGLPAALERQLVEHLGECADCRQERSQLERLGRVLEAERYGVRAGFAEHVVELATAGWPATSSAGPTVKRPWRLAVAMMLLLVTGAALLFAASATPAVSLAAAVGDFFGTTVLAGAGLLAASWRGVGMAVESWLSASLPNLIVSLFLIVSLNLLLLRLLRRRAAAGARMRRAGRR